MNGEAGATATSEWNKETAIQRVADAMHEAASTATEHAADTYAAVGSVAPGAARAISRATYTSAYVVSYGVIYATVFVASVLLLHNPLMRGFFDGGAAAYKNRRRA
jgi:hypothetical protein